MRKTTLTLILLLSLLAVAPPPPAPAAELFPIPWASAGRNMFETHKDKAIVVYCVPYDWHYVFNQRERFLLQCPQLKQLVPRFHWVKVWSVFGWAKDEFKEQGPALLVYAEKERILGKVNLLQSSNREVIEKLCEIANIEVEDTIPEFPALQPYFDKTGAIIQSFNDAARSSNLDRCAEAIAELETLNADDVSLPHMRNELAGLRSRESYTTRLAKTRKTLDLAVVVPDVETFLVTLAEWDRETMFPNLVWDDFSTINFLRAYKPSRVFFAPSVKKTAKADDKAIWASLCSALKEKGSPVVRTGDSASYKALRNSVEPLPAGVVFIDPAASGVAAGAMLAAGRWQVPVLAGIATGSPGQTVDEKAFTDLQSKLWDLVDATGYKYKSLFDELDYFTFACDFPTSVNQLSRMDKNANALDDALFRNPDDTRQGFAGFLFGDEAYKLYMANCSLFLGVDSSFFFDTYGGGATWEAYSVVKAESEFDEMGLAPSIIKEDAGVPTWREHHERTNTARWVHANSSGGQKDWSTRKGKGSYMDVPLTLPAMVSFTHSNSSGNAFSKDTIAGRWLKNGAFIYFGSHREPLLNAFNPPTVVAQEMKEGWPAAYFFRKKMGSDFWTPWKCIFFGDPMYMPLARVERVTGNGPLDAKYLAAEVTKLTLKAPAATPEKRIPRDTEALRSASVDGVEAFQAVLKPSLAYVKLKKKLPPELAALFFETAISVAAALEDHESLVTCGEFAASLGVPGEGVAHPYYETAKTRISAITNAVADGRTTAGDARKTLAALLLPLCQFGVSEGDAKYLLERLKASLEEAKDAEGYKAIHAELEKVAPKDSGFSKALAAVK